MHHRIIVAALAAAAFTAVSSAPAAAHHARGDVLRGAYLGSYTAFLSADQALDRGDPRMAGKFTLVLRSNGTYSDSNPLDGASKGRLADIGHHRLRFYRDRGCLYGNFERPQGGVYQWSLNGRSLTLRLVNEGPCTGRTQTLAYPVWRRTR